MAAANGSEGSLCESRSLGGENRFVPRAELC